MNGKHVPTENKILIIEILRWAKIIDDAGGGHIAFVPGKDVLQPGNTQKEASDGRPNDNI